MVDFLGVLTDAKFRVDVRRRSGRKQAETMSKPVCRPSRTAKAGSKRPTGCWPRVLHGAAMSWLHLGACYGAQAVGSCRAMQLLNPMPYKLVAVEPEPDNYEWTRRHMRDNSIDPDDQWLVKSAISARNDPVLFPIGSPGSGAQNCVATNEDRPRARSMPTRSLPAGRSAEVLRNLMTTNSTGLTKNLVEGENFPAEIKMVSAVTLQDILSPFDVVDYVESDIQQSEILVFPPFMTLLKRKVRRVHIGTHGLEVHNTLLQLFERDRWDIVFNYEPNSKFTSPIGRFFDQ